MDKPKGLLYYVKPEKWKWEKVLFDWMQSLDKSNRGKNDG